MSYFKDIHRFPLPAIILVLCFCGSALGDQAAREWGWVVSAGGDVPYAGDTDYIVFKVGDVTEIHTKWGVDAENGVPGYASQSTVGVWIAEPGNLNPPNGLDPDTDQFALEISWIHGSVKERAYVEADVPNALNTGATPRAGLDLTMDSFYGYPDTPVVLADFNESITAIALSWTNEPGVAYDVYLSENPSGGANALSNGRYNRIAEDVTSPYTLTTYTVPTGTKSVIPYNNYWFVVIGKDGDGDRSMPSQELYAPAEPTLYTPTMTEWGILLTLALLSLLLVGSRRTLSRFFGPGPRNELP
jgi:hypothetical protein